MSGRTCPICGVGLDPSREPPSPFCSDRCRMVDLGRWLTGQYVIPGDPVDAPDANTPD